MKFVLILACLMAVACIASAETTVDEALHKALVEAGVDPEVASGWLSNFAKKVVSGVKKVVPYVQKGIQIYQAVGGGK